jgi:Flp pilus assembly pilin Flp
MVSVRNILQRIELRRAVEAADGATAIEYALIAMIFALSIVSAAHTSASVY